MSATYRIPVYNRRGTTLAEEVSNPPVILGSVTVSGSPRGKSYEMAGVTLELGLRVDEVGEVDPWNLAFLRSLVFIYEGDPADLKAIPSFIPERDPEEIP